MPLGGEELIDGQYTVTWNSSAAGIMEGDAGVPTIEQVNYGEAVNNTDAYGKTTIDSIFQGADWFAQFTCLEAPKGLALFWPFGTFGTMGVIGRLYYGMAESLILAAIAGTPASSSPASVTATKAILAPGFNTRLLYGPTLRKTPIRMILLPTSTGWVTTS
ncbi:MAG: hypothetical protein KGL39_07955 [Patescibacteria group bacterium]|nr:hypothetical protein [Patescibacteria group bacterium]